MEKDIFKFSIIRPSDKTGIKPYINFRCLALYNDAFFENYVVTQIINNRNMIVTKTNMMDTERDTSNKRKIYFNKEKGDWYFDNESDVHYGIASDEGILVSSLDDERVNFIRKSDYMTHEGQWITEPKINMVAIISYSIISHYPFIVKSISEDKTEITLKEYKGTAEVKGKIYGKNWYKTWVTIDYVCRDDRYWNQHWHGGGIIYLGKVHHLIQT
jgi:hypothetical protein